MGRTTGNYEQTECQEHPGERYVTTSLADQIKKRPGNGKVGRSYEGVRPDVSPHQSRFPEVAIEVRQEIGGHNAMCQTRPDQEWDSYSCRQDRCPVKQLTSSELTSPKQSRGCCQPCHTASPVRNYADRPAVLRRNKLHTVPRKSASQTATLERTTASQLPSFQCGELFLRFPTRSKGREDRGFLKHASRHYYLQPPT